MACWKKKDQCPGSKCADQVLDLSNQSNMKLNTFVLRHSRSEEDRQRFQKVFLTVKLQMQKYIFIASVHSVICFSSPALKGLKSKVLCAHIFINRDRAVLLNLSGCFLQLSCKLDQTKIKWERLYQSVNLQDTAASRDHNTHVLISLLL